MRFSTLQALFSDSNVSLAMVVTKPIVKPTEKLSPARKESKLLLNFITSIIFLLQFFYHSFKFLSKYIFNFYTRRMKKLAKWPPAIVMEFLRCTNRCVNSSLHARIILDITPGNASLVLPRDPPCAEAVIRMSSSLSLLQIIPILIKNFLLFFCKFTNKSIFDAGYPRIQLWFLRV